MPDHEYVEDDQAYEDLLYALQDGDGVAAAEAMRQLRDPIAPDSFLLRLLADMLEGNPSQDADFPWRLKMVARGRGRPPKPWARRANSRLIWREVKDALVRTGKLESAVAEVRKEYGFSRATIFKAYSHEESKSK
jgi:hypothetical protein